MIIEINKGIDEVNEVLEQIGLEINQSPDVSQKSSQQTRLKSYYTELKRLENEYEKCKKNNNNLYLDDVLVDDYDVGMNEDQKRSLLDNSDRIEHTGNQIQEAYR